MVSETTSRALWCRGAGCLSRVGTYFLATVGQLCMLFKWCGNLPQGHCGAGVQAVRAVSEPSSPALWGRGAGCLSRVGTYFLGTVGQWCKLFKWCGNLPKGYCGAGVQAVRAVSEPSSGARGCRLFK